MMGVIYPPLQRPVTKKQTKRSGPVRHKPIPVDYIGIYIHK